MLIFTDATFANNKDLSSQIGALLVAIDIDNNTNILYWVSIKCKRITRSILAFKLLGIVHEFNIVYLVKTILDLILNKDILLVIYINSKSFYNCLVKLSIIQEKRLIIDIIYI